MDGDYSYSAADAELTVTTSDVLIFDVILNATADRMAIGLDAFSGGNTSTLMGTWEGTLVTSSTTLTRTWVFAANTVTYTTSAGATADGDVTISTGTKDFEVSSTTNTIVLPNGTYTYLVIGDGITIAEPAEALYYFDKQ